MDTLVTWKLYENTFRFNTKHLPGKYSAEAAIKQCELSGVAHPCNENHGPDLHVQFYDRIHLHIFE